MNKGDRIILSILLLSLVGIGIWLLTDKKEASSEANKETSIKIEIDKEYIYDATYQYDNKYTEYERSDEQVMNTVTVETYGIPFEYTRKTQKLSDLKVPYININTNDAGKANKELEALYLKYAKEFDECKEDLDTDNGGHGVGCSLTLSYKTYTYDNILSVIVIDGKQATAPVIANYHIYNFDLTTGNLISYNDMLTRLGYNSDMREAIDKKINLTYDSSAVGDLSKACGKYKSISGNCYEITYKLFEESIEDNSVLFFVDEDGRLNILPILYGDFAQNGTENHYLVKIYK